MLWLYCPRNKVIENCLDCSHINLPLSHSYKEEAGHKLAVNEKLLLSMISTLKADHLVAAYDANRDKACPGAKLSSVRPVPRMLDI